ncbi:MAG: fibronectin type III domain-containing protein [Candidatus Thermoplasmatota archaeon]
MIKRILLVSLLIVGISFGSFLISDATSTNETKILNEDVKLTSDDVEKGDAFGSDVAIDGDYAVIGASYDDAKGEDSGSAYIFKKTDSSWVQQTKLVPNDLDPHDHFGSSVDIEGDYAIVGAEEYAYGISTDQPGSVYVFKRNDDTWVQQEKLLASDGSDGDSFGYSVDIDGNTLLIGAIYDDGIGENSGSAYVFKRNGDTWTQEAKLTASDSNAYDFFGCSVSLHDDTALIGAHSDSYYNSDRIGSAYFFSRNNGIWSQKTITSDGNKYNGFGKDVSIYDNLAVVRSESHACFFRPNGSSWIEKDKIRSPGHSFGPVFIEENMILISSDIRKKAYLYEYNDNDLIKKVTLEPTSTIEKDYFGSFVYLNNDTALISASGTYINLISCNEDISGSVYIFNMDYDGDGIGDSTDNDDDNDGYTDTEETEANTDPKNASDYPIAPDSPQNVEAVVWNGTVNLSWDSPDNVGSSSIIKYSIYRSTSQGDEIWFKNVTNNSYVDNDVIKGNSYFYQITAVNLAGESNKSEEVNAELTSLDVNGEDKDTPGFELMLVITAVAVIFYLKRRKKI